MDRPTAAAYARHAGEWIAARGPSPLATKRLERFAARLRRGARVADLGSGPGWYAEILQAGGLASVALDLTREMLREAGRRYPHLPRVQADLGALPFARGSFDGAWAINCLSHLSAAELPLALAHLHHSLRVDGFIEFTLVDLETVDPTADELCRGTTQRRFDDDRFGGRLFTAVTKDRARVLLEGAGFDRIRIERPEQRPVWLWIQARRSYTLPDYRRPGLDLLVCGLNPSLRAAESGIPFITGATASGPPPRRQGLSGASAIRGMRSEGAWDSRIWSSARREVRTSSPSPSTPPALSGSGSASARSDPGQSALWVWTVGGVPSIAVPSPAGSRMESEAARRTSCRPLPAATRRRT